MANHNELRESTVESNNNIKNFSFRAQSRKEWVHVVDLEEARVYASSAQTPSGDLLIIGGVGEDRVLDTVRDLLVSNIQ